MTLDGVEPAFLIGVSFALGACIGSFLNVVAYRLPHRESLVHPRSRCPICWAPIPAWANVPVLSYLWLRGRCFRCKVPISPRYPLVEAATGVLFASLMARALPWPGPELAVHWLLGATLVVITLIDSEHQIIPNEITYPGIPLGLLLAWWIPGGPTLVDAALGLGLAGGMMLGLSVVYEWWTGRVGLGMGDVKLMAMLGAFLGLQAALEIMAIGSILGLLWAVFGLAFLGAHRLTRIPFGPALAGAALLNLFWPHLLARVLLSLGLA